jgi:hypothetical protein
MTVHALGYGASEHAPLPFSSAHLWRYCAGWRRMQEQVEPLEEDATSADEGTAAHWAMAEVLSGRPIWEGQTAPNGVSLTDEMCEGADLMDDAVGALRDSLHVEERVPAAYIHEDNWGTPDAWRMYGGVLDVWEYKYGFRHVPEYENWQLINQAVAVMFSLYLHEAPDRWDTPVRLTVVQPRDYHASGPVRTWTLTVRELIVYADKLKAAAFLAYQPEPECTPHASCGDCKARHACPALQGSALAWAEQATPPLPLVLTPLALSRQLAVLDWATDLIKARRDGLAAQAMDCLRRGETLPGWALKQGAGRERWKAPLEEVLSMASMLGVDISKPGALTPKQAIKAGLPAEVVKTYSETPVGELKLVRDDGSAARIAFGVKFNAAVRTHLTVRSDKK